LNADLNVIVHRDRGGSVRPISGHRNAHHRNEVLRTANRFPGSGATVRRRTQADAAAYRSVFPF
jgi:hypothetical protein